MRSGGKTSAHKSMTTKLNKIDVSIISFVAPKPLFFIKSMFPPLIPELKSIQNFQWDFYANTPIIHRNPNSTNTV